MDLSSNSILNKAEQFEIASTLHAMLLEELFRETSWLAPQAVFHGGTALALIRDSLRFSEDLDFMVTPEAIEGLDIAIEKVRGRVDFRMSMLLPGGRVSAKGPKGDEVTKWEFKWDHPGRRGKVMVKAEFLVASANLLAAYRSTHVVPLSRGAVAVSTPIPVPDLISAWADKIKAIATRPAFKWRDAFDLAWIVRCLTREDGAGEEEKSSRRYWLRPKSIRSPFRTWPRDLSEFSPPGIWRMPRLSKPTWPVGSPTRTCRGTGLRATS